MITKLRRQFIIINMLLAVLVLVTTFGVVIYLDYTTSFAQAYQQLDATIQEVTHPKVVQIKSVQPLTTDEPTIVSVENMDATNSEESSPDGNIPTNNGDTSSTDRNGVLSTQSLLGLQATPEQATDSIPVIGSEEGSSDEGTSSHSAPAEGRGEDNVVTAPSIGEGEDGSGTLLIAAYEVQDNGIYTAIPTISTASIAENILLRANDLVMASPENHGDLEEYNLLFAKESYNGKTIVAYGDDASTSSWIGLAWMLFGVGVAALAVFFLINIFFSNWALRPVRESIQRQRQFTADASHELKTPLTVILANMAILRSSPKDSIGDQIQWVDSTQKEAERMQLLVSDMLDLAKLQAAPDTEVDKVKLDFSDLVEGEVLQFESVAFERGIAMESSIDPGLYVFANPVRCERMVSTLLDNACKYVNTGGDIRVKLTVRRLGALKIADAVLTINNTGPVISSEDLPHLFNRFYRADKARTGSKGGYGLGLAIAREIALNANGDITVRSSEEEGTTFTVTMPLAV